jgi:ubiquinone/menaquinone biosynthesis C-methylase UbiE
MRILDIGCGAGDVSFLAARLVGPNGAVIGVDRSTEAIGVASSRAVQSSVTNVRFIESELDMLTLPEPVDMVLETRLRDEAVALNATLIAPPLIGAWARNG